MKPGERIKKIYEHLGMSQRAFSASVGMGPTSLAKIVSGQTAVSRLLANSIELIHGYSADWIIREDEIFDDFGLQEADPQKNLNPVLRAKLASIDQFNFEETAIFLEKGLTTRFDNVFNSLIQHFEQSKLFNNEEYGKRIRQHIIYRRELSEFLSKIKKELGFVYFINVIYRVFTLLLDKGKKTNLEKMDKEMAVDARTKKKIVKASTQIDLRIQEITDIWTVY